MLNKKLAIAVFFLFATVATSELRAPEYLTQQQSQQLLKCIGYHAGTLSMIINRLIQLNVSGLQKIEPSRDGKIYLTGLHKATLLHPKVLHEIRLGHWFPLNPELTKQFNSFIQELQREEEVDRAAISA